MDIHVIRVYLYLAIIKTENPVQALHMYGQTYSFETNIHVPFQTQKNTFLPVFSEKQHTIELS